MAGLRTFLARAEAMFLRHLQTGFRIPREVVAHEHREHPFALQFGIARSCVWHQLRLGQRLRDPVLCGCRMRHSVLFQPPAIQHKASALIIGSSVFEGRILAPYHQRDLELHSDGERDTEQRHMHRDGR